MMRAKPRYKHTKRFAVGGYLPAIDHYDGINGQSPADLVHAALPHLDAEEKQALGLGGPPDGVKVGEGFAIGNYVPTMDQEMTYDLVEAALPHLDEAEIFRLVMGELSPAGRARLLKLLAEEARASA